MYKQLNVEKVLNIVERMKALAEELESEVASTSTETVEETTATVAETEIIEHDGLKLKRVNRIAKPGDYIRPTISVGGLKSGEIYGPVKQDDIVDELVADGRLIYWRERTPSTVEVFEVIDVQAEKLPFPEVELTANQKRAKLIEQAKKFVEEQVESHKRYYLFNKSPIEIRFVVNSKKRTVVCLITDLNYGLVTKRGIAKCAPDDVFNEHIGKAIALARALEIDVPNEFLKAVQPDEVVMGMDLEIRTNGKFNFTHKPANADDLEDCNESFQSDNFGTFIIDDTNAQYEVV
ncbi:hypothetical protein CW357_00900 [Rummeliibacillus sp. TYF005]|uniref:hypothetical protein n=1 Tax=Rummeliibacillus sp. TYF005 TaxID=2058214 RepID=UPI000F530B96|nr:hypothetical protein [Rummeliibacillus sp. TYF005]RPJ97257.1 hypothetical protein CW357_00900 [Rummeliibacillus sp. TYF005]